MGSSTPLFCDTIVCGNQLIFEGRPDGWFTTAHVVNLTSEAICPDGCECANTFCSEDYSEKAIQPAF